MDDFVLLRQLFSQNLILFSQIDKFFLDRHAVTLLDLTPFGKSPADLPGQLPYFYAIEGTSLREDPQSRYQEELVECVV